MKAQKLSASNGRARKRVDMETRLTDEHHQALKLWLRLLSCTNLVEAQVRSRLRTEFDTTLPRFDLLAQLERNPGGLKMSELSRRLMVSGGNVTGLTDQLEKEGLVARADDPGDRRAYTVKLTAAGRTRFARMATMHEQWVIELFAGLSSSEKTQVHRLLAKLKLHLAGTATPSPSRGGRG